MKTSEITDSKDHITETALHETNIALLQPPAILLVVRGMILARRVPIAVTRVPVTINQDMKALCPVEQINARYLTYALQASKDALAEMIDEAGHGTKRLPTVRWRQLDIWMPPPDEQKAIADYLDANAVKVRRFIRNRRRLIEVLNEQKQAIINRAVTRGLDPNASLKPSGIDWLGDIPEHWEVLPLKRATELIAGGATPESGRAEYWGGDVVWVTPTDVSKVDVLTDSERHLTQVGLASCSAVVVPAGSIVLTSRAPVGNAAIAAVPLCTNQGCKAVVPDLSKFLSGYLHAELSVMKPHLQSVATGTTFTEIDTSSIANEKVAVPPLHEQDEIVAAIKMESRVLDKAIGNAQREIDLIREYRTRLIADVVTGKVDVRGLATAEAPLDDEQIDDGIDDEEMLGDDEPELVEEAER